MKTVKKVIGWIILLNTLPAAVAAIGIKDGTAFIGWCAGWLVQAAAVVAALIMDVAFKLIKGKL